ncbi:MAG TPA: alpha-D-ribose 1-methylphosphonate 5-triphosphate diphosphatase [Stellaceae bacterium]|jgi:alpha-D-ribose 1-methylphosphonate 5-triphosphate diphosphatase|nr:alpha-D-ribose 1-methylphosphonate 5-triphosphate diphosphatase [Stellaceae bacterium]
MNETLFTNARIVTRENCVLGDLLVRDGQIARIEPAARPSAAPGAIDLGGDFLLPGLVELHTDNLERHATPRPRVRWPAVSAVITHDAQMAASGITTIYDALAIGDIQRGGDRIEALGGMVAAVTEAQQSGMLRADHRLHLRCELSFPDLPALLTPLAAHPMVGLMSLMDHTPGQRQFVSLDQFKTYYQGKYNLSDAALADFIRSRQADQERYAADNRAMVIGMARQRGIRLASHDDATLAHVEEARQAGVVIAEFPTTAEAATAAHGAGMSVLGGAPNVVRGGSHSGNASALDFARAGILDILSSDYVPVSLLHAAFKLTDEAGFTLPDAVATVSNNPAASVGLADRGRIETGLRADLVRVAVIDKMPFARTTWRLGERIA